MLTFLVTMLMFAAAVAIIAAIGIRWNVVTASRSTYTPNQTRPSPVRPSGLILGAMILLLGIFACASIVQVQPSEAGVVLQLGKVTGRTLSEGPHVITPFIENVEIMDTQTHVFVADAEAASKDLQDVQTQVAINYHLDFNRAGFVYQTLRRDYVARILTPNVQEAVKAVTAVYNADELITRRADVKLAIERALEDRVAPTGLVVENLSITNFTFSEVFNAAIEAKVTAQQQALEAENRLRQIEVEAKQVETRALGEKNATIQRAEGERQAVIARAQGEAESIKLRADAQAVANIKIAESVTDPLVRWQIASTLAPGIQTVVLPSGSDFILGPEVLGPKQ